MTKIRPFDAAEFLDTPEVVEHFLTEAVASKDPALIAKSIHTVAGVFGRLRQRPPKALERYRQRVATVLTEDRA